MSSACEGGVRHMASLIDGLLAYSRVEHYSVQLERIELLALVTEMMETLASQRETQDVRIEVEVQPLVVRADREGLRLVLRNRGRGQWRRLRSDLP